MSGALRRDPERAADAAAAAAGPTTREERLAWGCVAKVGFAHAEAQRIAKRARRRRGERVQAYHCRRCHRCHIGHSDRSRR